MSNIKTTDKIKKHLTSRGRDKELIFEGENIVCGCSINNKDFVPDTLLGEGGCHCVLKDKEGKFISRFRADELALHGPGFAEQSRRAVKSFPEGNKVLKKVEKLSDYERERFYREFDKAGIGPLKAYKEVTGEVPF